jgi:hypothetical protein
MGAGVLDGSFAHVSGTFDLDRKKGTIDYVIPVKVAVQSEDFEDEGIELIALDGADQQILDKKVNPQRNSCAPHASTGTFEEYVPVSPQLRSIKLVIRGVEAAKFTRGVSASAATVAMGGPDPASPNRFSLNAAQAHTPAPGVTYTVQAKAEHEPNWQTIAVGLPAPSTDIDVNQFPGAKSVSVRVLQSDGFSEQKVFEDTKTF